MLSQIVFQTAFFLGRLYSLSGKSVLVYVFWPNTDSCPSWISWRERMTVENISWTQRTHDVYTTSLQRRCNVDVASTLRRRCINVMCPLGSLSTKDYCRIRRGSNPITILTDLSRPDLRKVYISRSTLFFPRDRHRILFEQIGVRPITEKSGKSWNLTLYL